MLGASNGWYRGTQYFACPENRGVFVPFTRFALDPRFGRVERENTKSEPEDFGGMECPVVEGHVAPVDKADLPLLEGINRGVQGHQNSCYLDATLFSMFTFTS